MGPGQASFTCRMIVTIKTLQQKQVKIDIDVAQTVTRVLENLFYAV
jgi:hypothetical protein